MKTGLKVALIFLAGAALGGAWPGRSRPSGLAGVYEDLGLTAAVAPETAKLNAKVEPKCRALVERRRALYAELRKDAPDGAAVARLAEECGAIRNAIQADVVEHLAAVRPLLTTEQRELLFDTLSGEAGHR